MAERALSHWGWGWADRFPSAEERRGVGEMAAGFLKLPEAPEPAEPVPLSRASLPARRLPEPPKELAEIADSSALARCAHTWGRSWPDIFRGFHGDFSMAPDLVLTPETEAQISAAMAWAETLGAALIPFGGGTSVVGGVEGRVEDHYAGVISLDLRRMDRVLEVDETSRLARVQAGATGPRIEAQLAPYGLSLRHFPQSFEFSTLGGWIATRSGGHFATLYTHIDERVASARMLTPRGAYESRCLPGSGAGPSPDRSLVIGSEGILGVITEAWVRALPRPRWRAKASARFEDYAAGVDATRALAASGLHPANCRLLDGREAALFGVGFDGRSILLIGFESADHAPQAALERACEIAREHGGELDSIEVTEKDRQAPGDHGAWRAAFIDAPYLLNNMVSIGLIADTFETACTWSGFPALHRAVIRAVREASTQVCGRPAFVSCRFTHVYPDGPAPYYTFIAQGGDKEGGLARWGAIKAAASEALMAHGATITHHHAVGRLHRPWYEAQVPPLYRRALRAMKAELDPEGVLNPGVLVDPKRAR